MATSFYARNRPRLNLLQHAMQLDGQQKAMAHQERKADLAIRMGAADEDMINVGDTHIHHPPTPASAPRSSLGTLARLAVGAGLLATGVGTGVGGLLIADALKNWKPAAMVDTDTDTTLDIELVPNE
jgi:predicted O-methyltransferase YrrM